MDHTTGGEAEIKDFKATIIGGVIGAGLVYMGMKIFQSNVPYLSFNDKSLTVGIKLRI